jgi:hypothetical protein
MMVTLSYSVETDLCMAEVFPDGWHGDEPPTPNDVIKALKESGSKSEAVRDWDLLPSEYTAIEIYVVPDEGNPSWGIWW